MMPPYNAPSGGLDPLQIGGQFRALDGGQYEDFLGYPTTGAASFSQFWQTLGGGTADFAFADSTDHPGQIEINSAAAVSIELLYQLAPLFALPNGSMQITWLVKPGSTSTVAQAYALRAGLMNQANAAAPTDGIYFEYTQNLPNWQATNIAAGVQTQVDTGVAVAVGSFTLLTASRSAPGQPVNFSINGAAVAAFSTNVPSVNLGKGVQIQKTNGAVIQSIAIDMAFFQFTYTPYR